MESIAALAGLLATVATIACGILAASVLHLQRELDQLREVVRGLGLRVGAPLAELPPARPVLDEYSPDAVIDNGDLDREWQPPAGLR